ncbi:AraC family transcriptional regulator [Tsukamurella pulmonis]|uniref:AraC family transcriptional regulator n=1 Tax=Tsukamurella pulmonis TaxID=47312 RepID=UPI00140294BD|nr:AraC family transcriptional regulator [Tsukamurella pulmonis]
MPYTIDGLVTGAERRLTGARAHGAWRDWCSGVHGEFDISFDGDGYRGDVLRQRTDEYQLVSWTSQREHVRRDARSIRNDPRGHYELFMPLKGALHVGGDVTEGALLPGEMVLVSIDSPFVLAHDDDASALALLIPEHRVSRTLGSVAKEGVRLRGGRGLGRVTRDLAAALIDEREQLTAAEFDAACDRAVDLFCLAASGEADGAGTADDEVRAAVLRHVRAHATEPDLSLAGVAAAVGWSARHIQAVLSRTGETFSDAVRGERLELARDRLTDPRWAAPGIAFIADSVGYGSASAFSTAFNRRFGRTPRAHRAGAAD